MKEFFYLLKIWCDGMIARQIVEIKERGIYGGLICPACSGVHGRCYTAVHPLLYMARKTHDNKYIIAAERLIEWSDHVECPDGSFVNDTTNDWKGISAFAAVVLSESLYKYGDLLSLKIRRKLTNKVHRCTEFLYNDFNENSGNINYLISVAYALELGGKYQNNEQYRAKAKKCANLMLEYLTPNNLIYGEGGSSRNQRSQKGCYPIDIGYNVEESIGYMVLYALSTNDNYILNKAVEIAKGHADFFLPDGGWDNSFGTRMDKWTYWGSRTSDGCQPTYTLLNRYDKRFGFIACKNLNYLRRCTYNGLLHGGRDLYIHNEPPCIHHTFTHAEGLTVALEWMDENGEIEDVSRYDKCFEKYYEELDTYLYSSEHWRATITGYDISEKPNCHPTGGTISLLYHKHAGPVLVSSMTVFNRFEGMNSQRHMDCLDTPLTLRMQILEENIIYSNILDKKAIIKHIRNNEYFVTGSITDHYGNPPKSGEVSFTATYKFNNDSVELHFTHTGNNIDIYIPIISSVNEKVKGYTINRGKHIIELSSNDKIIRENKECIFNHVPGFEAVPYKIKNAKRNTKIYIKIR